jgi:hypothetical protein
MNGKSWRVVLLTTLVALLMLSGTRAQDGKVTDEGQAEKFKGKTFDLKEKGKAAIRLDFPAGKKAWVTVKSEKATDVNLYVYDADKKMVAKDDSPGPSCELNFTPKADGKYILEVRNLGPGDNRSTLKVSFKKPGKSEDKK